MPAPIDAFRFPVAIDRGLGTLALEHDYEAYVRQLIRQVLLTAPGERVNRPDFGAGLRRMVFAPTSEATASLLQTLIYESLERWLGGIITLNDVQVVVGTGRLDVTVHYILKARGEKRFLNLEVTA